MSRIHRRDPRGEWSLEFHHPVIHPGWGWNSAAFPASPLCLVSLAVSREEAYRLMETGSRGNVAFQSQYSYAYVNGDQLWASGIEVSAAEANRIANGEHPRDVLFGPPPACGYRLHAVLEQF